MSSRTPRFTCTARSRRKRSPTWPSSWIKTRPRLSPSGQVWSYLLSPNLPPPTLPPPPPHPPKTKTKQQKANNKEQTKQKQTNKTSKQNAAPDVVQSAVSPPPPNRPTPATQTSGQVCSSLSACLSVCLSLYLSLSLSPSLSPPSPIHLRTPRNFPIGKMTHTTQTVPHWQQMIETCK